VTGVQPCALPIPPAVQAKELLLEFYGAPGGKRPEALLFYRDGVSEGQFDQVLQASIGD